MESSRLEGTDSNAPINKSEKCPEEETKITEEQIPGNGLSKRAQKRMLKKEKWLQYRPIKRAKEKEKLKKRKEEARLNNVTLGPSRKALKNSKMSTSNCKVRVILDFSFDSLMKDKELHKCVNQMSRCYSVNRRSENPLQMYVTSFNGPSRDIIKKHTGFTNWDVNFHEEKYIDLFKKEELVYMTSDSENVINEIDENKAYIIGALVDHNSQKGLCLKLAKEQGIQHGRLPISEYLKMKTRQVLTVDHVFGILVNVASCGMSWKDAFLKIIPQRKGAEAKNESENVNSIINEQTIEETNNSLESVDAT